MEFLSIEEKRKRTIRLFLAYFLLATTIGLATMILAYMGQGYGYDSQNGVMRNGLVFIDSEPVSANITIDNKQKGTTDKKVSLAEGKHTITLKQKEYRDWSKSFSLEGGGVLYFLYPRLFPVDIAVGITRVYESAPAWVSQSPDRHWLIIQNQADSPLLSIVDLTKPNEEPMLFVIPAEQLASGGAEIGILQPVEWSSDNRHLLIKQTSNDQSVSYLVFDRENPDNTVNISKLLALENNHEVILRDKKYDKFYIHNKTTGDLTTADAKNGLVEQAIAKNVVSFNTHGEKLIAYTTYDGAKPGEARLYVLDGKNLFLLQSLPKDEAGGYLIDMAKFQNNWFYIAASKSGKKVNIYRNPLKRAEPNNPVPIAPQMSLNFADPRYVSFSENTRFIAAQSGKNFVVFDAEQNRVYRFTSPLNFQIDQEAEWMDGHRFSVVADGKVRVFEFDGGNMQELINSRPEYKAYFDRDYLYVFTLVAQADGKTGFENGKLFIEED